MARNISFMLTTEQIRNRTKTVTRRLGWQNLQPGTILNACEKCMGLKKGEKINKLCQIRVVSVQREFLNQINYYDVVKEGFPQESPDGFINMFKKHMNCKRNQKITRIEFEYIGSNESLHLTAKGRGEK